MFPWTSLWSTSGKPGLPELGLELVRAHRLGARGEVAQPLSQVQPLEHLGEGGARVGGNEQVRPDTVFRQVVGERPAVGRPRIALAVAPDRVGLVREVGGDLL